jgi:TolB-like protein/class 3 adenylate cyclase
MSAEDSPKGAAMPQRRHGAVIFADLVESVRLMRVHEADTIERWQHFVAAVRADIAPRHRARLVRTAGDGLLLQAADARDAVALAFALHAALEAGNAGRAGDELMQLRVGIHQAELLFDEHDVQGDGANLAARLYTLGQAGCTIVSTELRSGLVDRVHAEVEDLGPRYLKGFDEPVRAFALWPPGRAGAAGGARPLPSAEDLRPAVAVVPFVALPPDPEHDALGFAMADDIIATLSRHPGLRVLSRHSTAALREGALDVARARSLLGAAFLLSGRFYVRGTRIRLAAELCDLRDGEVLWTGGATADVDSLFEGRDDLVPDIVANVASQVLAFELGRVRSLPMTALAPYTLYLGAGGLMNSLVKRDFERAREVFEHLAERHPRQASTYAMLARWHVFNAVQGWSGDAQADSRAARALAQRAIEIDPAQPVALAADGLARMNFDNDLDGARERYLAAIGSDPQAAYAWAHLSAVHSQAGEHEAAVEAAQRSLLLSPLDPALYLYESYAATALLGAGRFAEAVEAAQSSLRRHVLHAPSHRMLVGALWLRGRADDARAAAARYMDLLPAARAGAARRGLRGEQPVWGERFIAALRAAGLPA